MIAYVHVQVYSEALGFPPLTKAQVFSPSG